MTTNDPNWVIRPTGKGSVRDQQWAMDEDVQRYEDEICNQVEPPNPDEYEDLGCPDCGWSG